MRSSARILALSTIIAIASAACGGGAFTSAEETGGSGGTPAGSGGASGGGLPGTGGSDLGVGGGDTADAAGMTDDGAIGLGDGGGIVPEIDGTVTEDASSSGDASFMDASAGCPACPAGQYCNMSTRSCAKCGDLSRLAFGTPRKLVAPSAGPGRDQVFAREASRSGWTGLVYGFANQGNPDIAFASGTTGVWPTGTALPPPVSSAGFDDAPLPMPDPVDITLLYDTEVNNRRMIYLALYSSNGTWSTGRYGPDSWTLNSSGNNYHVAALRSGSASGGLRLWWTTDRQDVGVGQPRLVTTDPLVPAAPVDVPIVLSSGCHTKGDLEPWVAPDGTVLFFSSLPLGAGGACDTRGDDSRHLYFTRLDPATGQQSAGDRALAIGVHAVGFDDRAPSLTTDMCSLLFSSDRDAGNELDIYIAPRN
jgi:hypothetical protein